MGIISDIKCLSDKFYEATDGMDKAFYAGVRKFDNAVYDGLEHIFGKSALLDEGRKSALAMDKAVEDTFGNRAMQKSDNEMYDALGRITGEDVKSCPVPAARNQSVLKR
jgi:hypothetical protein